eukprot:6474187-Amphidinium_carterae.1
MDSTNPTGSTKVPPSWNPDNAHAYSLENWSKDVRLWAATTDLRRDQLGPAVALRLQGLAKTLAREVPTNILINGDTVGGVTLSGLDVLIAGLEKRFQPLGIELGAKAIAAYFTFKKLNSENIDQAIARWQLIKQRAFEQGSLGLSPSGHAWLLMQSLGIPAQAWIPLLQRYDGVLPSTDQELEELLTLIRRQGHLGERGGLVDIARHPEQAHHHMREQAHHHMSRDGLRTSPPSMSSGHGQGYLAITDGGEAHEGGSAAACMWPEHPRDDGQDLQLQPAYNVFEHDEEASDASSDTEADVNMHLNDEDYAVIAEDEDVGDIFTSYLIAKAKWRRFSRPRRHQHQRQHRHQRPQYQGGGGGNKYQVARPRYQGAAPYPQRYQRAYATGQAGNPRGADGLPLKCSHCGSTDHLWRKCSAPGSEEFKKQKLMGKGGKGEGKGQAAQRFGRVHFSASSTCGGEALATSDQTMTHNLAFLTTTSAMTASSDFKGTLDSRPPLALQSSMTSMHQEWRLVNPPPAPDHSPRMLSLTARPKSPATPKLPFALEEGLGGLPPPQFTEDEIRTLNEHVGEGISALRHLPSPRRETEPSTPKRARAESAKAPPSPSTPPMSLKPAAMIPSEAWGDISEQARAGTSHWSSGSMQSLDSAWTNHPRSEKRGLKDDSWSSGTRERESEHASPRS